MILYRPVGMLELRLIFDTWLKAFPPRLPEQPIFYPVLNLEYARQIAFDWNIQSEPYAGYVTEFDVDDAYISQFEHHIVGGRQHEELWIPAENLDEFNRHIIGQIRVVDARFGDKFTGWIAESAGLQGIDAAGQFILIANTFQDSPVDAHMEIAVNSAAVFLNYPFWQHHDFTADGIEETRKAKTFLFIHHSWSESYPEIPLGIRNLRLNV